MFTKEIKGIRIRYENGFEGLFRTFDFVRAKPVKDGIVEITIQERFFLFFPSKPRSYCGIGSRWRNSAGEKPPLAEGLYLCQCWLTLMRMTARRGRHIIHENPLRM